MYVKIGTNFNAYGSLPLHHAAASSTFTVCFPTSSKTLTIILNNGQNISVLSEVRKQTVNSDWLR